MNCLAWTYVRWSKVEQGEAGRDSESRQLRDVADFCRRHHLDADPSRVIVDRGRSGYAGAHLARGELGKFIRRVELGEIPAGSVLVVEEFDRLSRLPIGEATKIIDLFTAKNIRVGVVATDQILDSKSKNNLLSVIGMTLRVYLATEESEKKRTRSRSAWIAKRKHVEAGGKLAGYHPGWLRLDGAGKWQFVREKVKSIAKIFDLYLTGSGMGTHRIASHLNANGYPTMRDGGRWVGNSVRQVLLNPAVHGEWTPRTHERVLTNEEVDEEVDSTRTVKVTKFLSTSVRDAAMETIPDYYKAVVDRATWERAVAKLQSDYLGGGGRGEMSNVFQRIMRCAECGGPVQQVARRGHRYLFCYHARHKTTPCPARGGVKLETVARPILERAALAFDVVGRGASPERVMIEAEIAEKTAERTRLAGRRDRLLFADDEDDGFADAIKTLGAKVKELDTDIAAAQRRLIAAQARQSSRPVEYDAMIDDFLGPEGPARDKACRRLNGALREVISEIRLIITQLDSEFGEGAERGTWVMKTINGWATTHSTWTDWSTHGSFVPTAQQIADDPEMHPELREQMRDAISAVEARPQKGRDVAARVQARQRR